MQALMQQVPFSIPHLQSKPILLSLDSGSECSLEHWLEVHFLVEEEDFPVRRAGEAPDWN